MQRAAYSSQKAERLARSSLPYRFFENSVAHVFPLIPSENIFSMSLSKIDIYIYITLYNIKRKKKTKKKTIHQPQATQHPQLPLLLAPGAQRSSRRPASRSPPPRYRPRAAGPPRMADEDHLLVHKQTVCEKQKVP